MVLNSWTKVRLICGNHDTTDNVMEIHEGKEGMSPFYYCTKYVSVFSKDNKGHSCNNRLSINDYEKMLEYIMDEKYTDDGDVCSVVGMKWKKNNIEYKVIDDKDGVITVVVNNYRAIGR